VAIARAIVGGPAVVLADEPTGNLDSATGEGIVHLLTSLADGDTTVIVITHNADVAGAMSRRIHLVDGRIVRDSAVFA
jgi:putative ABC transport system ATP-binding protein